MLKDELKMDFKKSAKQELIEKYPYKTELHAHTSPVSTCSEVTPQEAVKIYKELGYTSIVIANHFYHKYMDKRAGTSEPEGIINYYLNDYREAKKEGEKIGLNVILASELRFENENDNDYLLYGIDEKDLYDILPYLENRQKEFYENYMTESKLLFQAHPFRNGMVLVPPELVDGYEAYNFHPNHNSRPALAARYAKSVEKPFIIGTDFHEHPHAGLTAIRTMSPLVNSHDVVNAIKENDFIMEIDGAIVLP